MPKFNRHTFGQFGTLVKLFFKSEVRWKALGLFGLIVACSLSLSFLNVQRSYVDRDFTNALLVRDENKFINMLYLYLLIFGALTTVAVLSRYIEERFGLMWRDWMSRKILDTYFSNKAYYNLSLGSEIDNPDQRIQDDIRTFTITSLSFTIILFNSFVTLCAFVGVLWSISFNLTIGAVVYAIFGSIVTYYLGRPLLALNYSQLKKEADYRYKLVNIRDYAESVAFYRGENKEGSRTKERLRSVILNMLSIINWNRNLGFFTWLYNYVLAILPTILVAPLYLRGEIEFGVVFQAGGAFGQVLGALSIIVVHFGGISSLAAVTERLGSFWDEIKKSEPKRSTESTIQIKHAPTLKFENVSISPPNQSTPFVKYLSFELELNECLLITGPSGSGKSSILRACAGLWNSGSGTIYRPDLHEVMFIPQRPYTVLGDFRSQFLYGAKDIALPDRELIEIVKEVGLEETLNRVGGLDVELDWKSILSLGEQQQIAFARILVNEPVVAFLDEATNALDEERSTALYELMRKRVRQYISVGMRTELSQFHDRILTLGGKGNYRVAKSPQREKKGGS